MALGIGFFFGFSQLSHGPAPQDSFRVESLAVVVPVRIEGTVREMECVCAGDNCIGTIKLVTAQRDTFLLFHPGLLLRCAPGTTSELIGYGTGTKMRVFLKPNNLDLARTKFVPVEWAEVECVNKRP